MSGSSVQLSQREWGELGKKIMELRRRLSPNEQAALDNILHQAFVSAYGSGDVQGYAMPGSKIQLEEWPAEPPRSLRGISFA